MNSVEDVYILVFTPMCYHEKFKAALHNAAEKIKKTIYTAYIRFKFAQSVDELRMISSMTLADFVIILVNTTEPNSISSCQRNILQLGSHHLSTRLCLVNGSCRSRVLSAAKELIEVADRFHIPIVNAEINDNSSCQIAAEKLLKLASTALGLHTGVPMIIPTVWNII